jgi:porphobilinogen deaminase
VRSATGARLVRLEAVREDCLLLAPAHLELLLELDLRQRLRTTVRTALETPLPGPGARACAARRLARRTCIGRVCAMRGHVLQAAACTHTRAERQNLSSSNAGCKLHQAQTYDSHRLRSRPKVAAACQRSSGGRAPVRASARATSTSARKPMSAWSRLPATSKSQSCVSPSALAAWSGWPSPTASCSSPPS